METRSKRKRVSGTRGSPVSIPTARNHVQDTVDRQGDEVVAKPSSFSELHHQRRDAGEARLLGEREFETAKNDVPAALFRPHLVDELGAERFGHPLSLRKRSMRVIDHDHLREGSLARAAHATVKVEAVIDGREDAVEDRMRDAGRQRPMRIPGTHPVHVHGTPGFEGPAPLPAHESRWICNGNRDERPSNLASADASEHLPGRLHPDDLVSVKAALNIQGRPGGSGGDEDRQSEGRAVGPRGHCDAASQDGTGALAHAEEASTRPRSFGRHR